MQQMMDMMKQQMELQRQEIEHLKTMHQQAAAAPKQIKVSGMPQPNLSDGSAAVDPDANLDLIMEKAKKWHEYTACEQTPPSKLKK